MDAGEKGVIEIIECNQDDHAGFRGKRGNDAQHLDLDVEINSRRSGWRKPMINASSLTDCSGQAGKRETSQLFVSANTPFASLQNEVGSDQFRRCVDLKHKIGLAVAVYIAVDIVLGSCRIET